MSATNEPTNLASWIRKVQARAKRERWELELARQLRVEGLDLGMHREFRFHPDRKWRFDFAWPLDLMAVEIEGITSEGGRHQRVGGYQADLEKYNTAALSGWRIGRFTPADVRRGIALHWIRRMIGRA